MPDFHYGRRNGPCSVVCIIVIVGPLVLGITFFFLFDLFTSGLKGFPHVDEPKHSDPSVSAKRKATIEETFDFAWDGYFKIAFPHDDLKPASEEAGFSRNDWGATAIDALGTAILMEKTDVVHTVLEHVQQVDFSKTLSPISVFETTIRYVGGMLSAYDLLTDPFKHLVKNQTLVDGLLEQSETLGDILTRAFVDGHVLPHPRLKPNAEGVEDDRNSLAGAGTLVLEWSRLSDISGNKRYENLSRSAEDYLLNPIPKESEPLPGLVGTKLDVVTGHFIDRIGGWGGSGDSFYEYLIKMYLYDPKTFAHYKDRWVLAADSTMKHLASSPYELPNITFVGKFADARSVPESGHMECFAGGNFLLAGQILDEKRYTEFGLKLIEGCRYQYESTETKLGPEAFRWLPSVCTDPSRTRWICELPKYTDDEYNKKHKFWIVEPSYNLRPEAIESYYYAYRMTRDEKYRDWAWDAFVAINATTRMEHGFNYYRDVRVVDGQMGNNQESYFFSETLKYLWLIFDDKDDGREWHVNAGFKGKNKWVYNTEGHPLRIR